MLRFIMTFPSLFRTNFLVAIMYKSF